VSIKSTRKKSLGFIVLVLVLGAFIGSALGEVIGFILPAGVVNDFFTRAVIGGLGPTTLNLLIITFTIGFTFKLNLIGVVGIFIAAYLLRWY
jgi:hypothetical protein